MQAKDRIEQVLLDKLRALPPERVAEVEDFVDFLTSRGTRYDALDRLLAVTSALDASGLPPMSEAEVVAEVKAARAERRTRQTADTAEAKARR